MLKKIIKLRKSFLLLWIAILGLGFTTFSFYTLNSKQLLVEITEEMNEDGNDLDEEDGLGKDDLNKLIQSNILSVNENISLFTQVFSTKAYSTSTGHLLNLIKPPLV
jgi:hypothetical protein